jgi:hypothetical protein
MAAQSRCHALRNVQRAVDVRGFAGEAREHAPDSSGDYAAALSHSTLVLGAVGGS